MADKKIDAELSTTIGDLLAALDRDGERILVSIKGQPIVLAIHRERATEHLSLEEKMKLLQGAFADTDGSADEELKKFKSPLDYE
jgi:hypothetical protein